MVNRRDYFEQHRPAEKMVEFPSHLRVVVVVKDGCFEDVEVGGLSRLLRAKTDVRCVRRGAGGRSFKVLDVVDNVDQGRPTQTIASGATLVALAIQKLRQSR